MRNLGYYVEEENKFAYSKLTIDSYIFFTFIYFGRLLFKILKLLIYFLYNNTTHIDSSNEYRGINFLQQAKTVKEPCCRKKKN